MKTPNLILLSMACCLFAISGLPVNASLVVSSIATNDLVVSVAVTRSDEKDQSPIKQDELLYYEIRTTTNGSSTFLLPKDEFFFKAELIGKDGKPARRTTLGEKAGARFDDLKTYSREAVHTVNRYGHLAIIRIFGDGGTVRGMAVARQHLSVDKLFQLEAGKEYVLRIQFQVFRAAPTKPDSGKVLVRLPPIETPVRAEKSPPKPKFAPPLPVLPDPQ